jgi:hypothetical protein
MQPDELQGLNFRALSWMNRAHVNACIGAVVELLLWLKRGLGCHAWLRYHGPGSGIRGLATWSRALSVGGASTVGAGDNVQVSSSPPVATVLRT